MAASALHIGFQTPWLTVLGVAILLTSVADFVFPTAYQLTGETVSTRGPLGQRRMTWSAVRCAVMVAEGRQQGVLLSPVTEPGLARRWRSLWLPVADDGQPSLAMLVNWVERCATERSVPVGGSEAAHD